MHLLHKIKILLVILKYLKALIVDFPIAHRGLKWDRTYHILAIKWSSSLSLASHSIKGWQWPSWSTSTEIFIVFISSILCNFDRTSLRFASEFEQHVWDFVDTHITAILRLLIILSSLILIFVDTMLGVFTAWHVQIHIWWVFLYLINLIWRLMFHELVLLCQHLLQHW